MLGVKSLFMYFEPCHAMSAIVVAMRSPPLQHVGLLSIRSELHSSSTIAILILTGCVAGVAVKPSSPKPSWLMDTLPNYDIVR